MLVLRSPLQCQPRASQWGRPPIFRPPRSPLARGAEHFAAHYRRLASSVGAFVGRPNRTAAGFPRGGNFSSPDAHSPATGLLTNASGVWQAMLKHQPSPRPFLAGAVARKRAFVILLGLGAGRRAQPPSLSRTLPHSSMAHQAHVLNVTAARPFLALRRHRRPRSQLQPPNALSWKLPGVPRATSMTTPLTTPTSQAHTHPAQPQT